MAEHLLLVRHGLIAANRDGRWHGSTDSPLVWQGRRQAKRTARHVRTRPAPFEMVYVSPLERCRSTAAPIAAAFGIVPVIHEDLREWDIGEWEDLPFRELARMHDFMGRIRQDPHFKPPGGESLAEVAKRMVSALQQINESHTGSVAVVGHGAAMAVALAEILDQDYHRWSHYLSDNCALTELVLGKQSYLSFFNRTEHL